MISSAVPATADRAVRIAVGSFSQRPSGVAPIEVVICLLSSGQQLAGIRLMPIWVFE
jgi:hypothetical protein